MMQYGNIPDDYFLFIEAQVWNYKELWDIYNMFKGDMKYEESPIGY